MHPLTIAAIAAAFWAHPQGVAYLEKIDRIEACANRFPCKKTGSGGPDAVSRDRYGGGGAREFIEDLFPAHLEALGWRDPARVPQEPAPPREAPASSPTQPAAPEPRVDPTPKVSRAAPEIIGGHASEALYDQPQTRALDDVAAKRKAEEEALLLLLTEIL